MSWLIYAQFCARRINDLQIISPVSFLITIRALRPFASPPLLTTQWEARDSI